MPPIKDTKYLDTVAAYLAAEAQKKKGAPVPQQVLDRVYTNRPNGIESSTFSGTGFSKAQHGDTNRADLEGAGYRYLPQDDFDRMRAEWNPANGPPPGKLPFISGLPIHEGRSTTSAPPPARDPGMVDAMAMAAEASRPLAGKRVQPPPAQRPAAPATGASGKRSREVAVRLTSETGSTPQVRDFQPLAQVAPPASADERLRGLPEGVAKHMQSRLEPAQEDASRRSLGVELASAFNQIGQGVAGSNYDDSEWAQQRRSARQPVEDAQTLTAEEQAQAEQERQQAAEERALAEATRRAEMEERRFKADRDQEKVTNAYNERRLKQDIDSAQARAEDARRDRYLRHQELLLRAKEGAESRKAAADQKREDMLGRQDEKDQQELAKRLQAAADAKPDLDLVMRYAMSPEDEDIPGIGFGVSGLPGAVVSQEGSDLRQAAIRLYRAKTRIESGQTVTPQEAATALEARGMGTWKTEGQWRSGMKALANETAAAMRNIESGFNPGVVDERSRRGGVTSRDIPTSGGSVRMVSPDGQQYTVDESEAAEAARNGWRRI